MTFIFEKLIVYQRAMSFAERICQLTEQFPRGSYHLSDQLNRAAVSISANIAEGNGRFTSPDRKNFFGIARGSAHECVALLELCHRRKLVPSEDAQQLKQDLEEIAKMLSGLVRALDDRAQ